MQNVIQPTEKIMQMTIDHLHEELKHVRTSRADPAILNNVMVEVYGTKMRLKELAAITTPEPRQILITPFDNQNTAAIRKGIESSNLNINPVIDGHMIRVNIPPMDQNMRLDMVKMAKKKGEESKISIRNSRRDGNETLKNQKAKNEISEDELKKYENEIQKLTDKFCKIIDEIISCKEKDIMAV